MINTLDHLIKGEVAPSRAHRGEFFHNRFRYANNLYHKDLKGHFSCVNAIEFSNRDSSHLISGRKADTRIKS